MKKKLVLLSMIGVLMLLLTGCALNKKALSNEDFIKKGEDQKLVIVDVKDQFEEYDFIKSATIAASPNGWQVEFYVLDTEENAKKMYNKNKDTFDLESIKKNSLKTEVGNYESYALDNEYYYMKIIRVENTFIYTKTVLENKDAVKAFLKELGY